MQFERVVIIIFSSKFYFSILFLVVFAEKVVTLRSLKIFYIQNYIFRLLFFPYIYKKKFLQNLLRMMYAIVTIAGQQFKVTEGDSIYVHRLEAEEGSSVTFDQVLMVEKEGSTTIGTPNVAGASVTATVEEHLKGDKVIVFKKKRRKGYRVKNGHRQYLTQITIKAIAL